MKGGLAGGPPPLVTYGYDLAGNRISKELENGTGVSYAYYSASRLKQLCNFIGSITRRMYIPLQTFNIWCIEGCLDLALFFGACRQLLEKQDVIVVGSYKPLGESGRILSDLAIPASSDRPFREFFEANRDEYPDGRSFQILCTDLNLQVLESLRREGEGVDYSSFDHIIAFRPGIPLVPLINYRNAEQEGDIQLSGLYSHTVVNSFADQLLCSVKRIINPDFGTEGSASNF